MRDLVKVLAKNSFHLFRTSYKTSKLVFRKWLKRFSLVSSFFKELATS